MPANIFADKASEYSMLDVCVWSCAGGFLRYNEEDEHECAGQSIGVESNATWFV